MMEFLRSLDWSYLTNIIIRILPALLCVTLHELAHGYTAYRLGDDTAKLEGRLTLNPIKHIDPIGLISMLVFGFGWAKPVPVNMFNMREPKKGMAITALAGPAMNVFIAAVAFLLYGIMLAFLTTSRVYFSVLQLLLTTAYLSCAFAVFNLLPIPPLDGSKIFFSFLPNDKYLTLMRYERYGMIIMLVLVFTGAIDGPLTFFVNKLYYFLYNIAKFAFEIVVNIIY